MRALLVHNPHATATRPAVTDVIAHALSSELKLDVEATQRHGHAISLAADAVGAGYEVVIAHGGDGTLNEVVQGIAGTDVKLAVIPGGSTNVWARTLGMPNDAVAATSLILRKLGEREDRRVNLGVANGRYFAFCAGLGYDAEVVRMVERRIRMKRTVRQASFLWCGFLAYLAGRGQDALLSLTVEGEPTHAGLRAVVCCNSSPYTYLGPLPALVCPDADLDRALDVTGLTRVGLLSLARLARAALTSGNVDRLGHVRTWRDLERYEVVATAPVPLHVDGEFVGETDRLTLGTARSALTVVA